MGVAPQDNQVADHGEGSEDACSGVGEVEGFGGGQGGMTRGIVDSRVGLQ